MQKELAVAALVAALALGRAVPGAAAEPLAVTPKIRTAVAGLAAQTLEKAPAGTVLELAIAEHGRLVDEETLVAGAHASPKKAATPTLGTGTIETLLTATLVMQLVAAGTLNLEEPVSTVLPNLPYGARITVGQLLSHRSGVADTIAEAIASGETARPTNTGALIAAIGAEQLAQPPDTTWAYSNAGYALLAAIVAATLHRPFAAVVDQKVFAPAGMRASSVGAPPKGAVLAAPLGGESFPDASWLYGCGDLFSNASDVARFDIALMDGTLLSLPQLGTMLQPATTSTFSPNLAGGLGFFIAPLAGRSAAQNAGTIPGYAALDRIVPVDGLAIVALSSDDKLDLDTLAEGISALLYPSASGTAAAASGGGRPYATDSTMSTRRVSRPVSR